MSYLIRWKRVGSEVWSGKLAKCITSNRLQSWHHLCVHIRPRCHSGTCHLMFWGYLSISFPFSVGWAPLVESWLIQRMDLGRMVKLGGSKIHATRQQTSYFNYILELKRHARCLLAPLSDCLLIRRFVCQFLLSSSMKWCQVMSSNCVGAVQLHFRYSFFSFVCHIYS